MQEYRSSGGYIGTEVIEIFHRVIRLSANIHGRCAVTY